MAISNKPVADLRIGAVKATVWGKRGRRHHPAQRHLFAHLSRRRPVEDHAQPSASTICLPSRSSPTRRTRSLPSAMPRRPRRQARPDDDQAA